MPYSGSQHFDDTFKDSNRNPYMFTSESQQQLPPTSLYASTHDPPQSWPPCDQSLLPPFQSQLHPYRGFQAAPAPYPRLSSPHNITGGAQHTATNASSSRLNLAGSLDPATGIFYRTPEHPRLRTAQACEKCRTRKAKCSGEHPSCKRCIDRGLVCEYAKEGRVRGPNKNKNAAAGVTGGMKNNASTSAGADPESSVSSIEQSASTPLKLERDNIRRPTNSSIPNSSLSLPNTRSSSHRLRSSPQTGYVSTTHSSPLPSTEHRTRTRLTASYEPWRNDPLESGTSQWSSSIGPGVGLSLSNNYDQDHNRQLSEYHQRQRLLQHQQRLFQLEQQEKSPMSPYSHRLYPQQPPSASMWYGDQVRTLDQPLSQQPSALSNMSPHYPHYQPYSATGEYEYSSSLQPYTYMHEQYHPIGHELVSTTPLAHDGLEQGLHPSLSRVEKRGETLSAEMDRTGTISETSTAAYSSSEGRTGSGMGEDVDRASVLSITFGHRALPSPPEFQAPDSLQEHVEQFSPRSLGIMYAEGIDGNWLFKPLTTVGHMRPDHFDLGRLNQSGRERYSFADFFEEFTGVNNFSSSDGVMRPPTPIPSWVGSLDSTANYGYSVHPFDESMYTCELEKCQLNPPSPFNESDYSLTSGGDSIGRSPSPTENPLPSMAEDQCATSDGIIHSGSVKSSLASVEVDSFSLEDQRRVFDIGHEKYQ